MILRKWFILPVTLIALSVLTLVDTLDTIPNVSHIKKWICSLKELYYLKKPHHLELRYDYNGDFFISNYQEPTTISSYSILV